MGRPDDIRVVLGVDGPGMASLQPASICWLINCSDTCREHIGLWLKVANENDKEPETPEADLPSDYINLHYFNYCKTQRKMQGWPHLYWNWP